MLSMRRAEFSWKAQAAMSWAICLLPEMTPLERNSLRIDTKRRYSTENDILADFLLCKCVIEETDTSDPSHASTVSCLESGSDRHGATCPKSFTTLGNGINDLA
jgi:hypothetical protein